MAQALRTELHRLIIMYLVVEIVNLRRDVGIRTVVERDVKVRIRKQHAQPPC